MTHIRIAVVAAACILLYADAAPEERTAHRQKELVSVVPCPSEDILRLTKELSLARKTGNITRVKELQAVLFKSLPSLPAGHFPEVVTTAPEELAKETANPLWGNDVKIFSGDLRSSSSSKRQIAIAADTSGGVYVGLNTIDTSGVSFLRFFKSTDGGHAWSSIGGARAAAGVPILSLDICVTDTSNGAWIIGYTFVQNTDDNATAGGTLKWGALQSDGTHHRLKTIASRTTSRAFRNPTICTDGAAYAPVVTQFYIASEFVTPSSGESRGIALTFTSDWGATWSALDTTLDGRQQATPDIDIYCGSDPDSVFVAYSVLSSSYWRICYTRTTFTFSGSWSLTYAADDYNDSDPSMAIDPIRGHGIIAYTRDRGALTHHDVMYLRSTDLSHAHHPFDSDSIATGPYNEDFPSANFAPSGSNYYWRVAYRTAAGSDTILYRSIYNSIKDFHSATVHAVSQFRPGSSIAPALGCRKVASNSYTGACIYSGYASADAYFDAAGLTVDTPNEEQLPVACALQQNYPNPFNPATHIQYAVGTAGSPRSAASRVRLAVYDMLGREVAVLTDGHKAPGTYTATWDAAGMASGVYYYMLTAGETRETKKMLLLQ